MRISTIIMSACFHLPVSGLGITNEVEVKVSPALNYSHLRIFSWFAILFVWHRAIYKMVCTIQSLNEQLHTLGISCNAIVSSTPLFSPVHLLSPLHEIASTDAPLVSF